MKRILVFGDSLSWGYIPGGLGKRYGADIRWPKVADSLLGDEFEIIEEALNGRTTVWDEPFRPGRNGATLLAPILESHAPLDLVVIMLGSNDLLHYRDVTSIDVARGMALLVDIARRSISQWQDRPPAVLVMSAPCGEELSPDMALYCKGDLAKFGDLAAGFQGMAKEKDCSFFDVSVVVARKDVSDGIHLNESANMQLAEHVAGRIKEILE